MGSPPRVREKPASGQGLNIENRITPASAGKTQIVKVEHCPSWDHPRECGKNLPLRHQFCVAMGSPPRVREKRKC